MKSEIGLAERVENPCVGGSIPPRATKNLNSPLVGLFLLEAVDGVSTLAQRGYLPAIHIAHTVVVAQVKIGTNLTITGNTIPIFKSCLKHISFETL